MKPILLEAADIQEIEDKLTAGTATVNDLLALLYYRGNMTAIKIRDFEKRISDLEKALNGDSTPRA